MITPATTPGRDVVAYPTCAASRCTVTEALAEMDALGYDFHLFTHASGQDCLLRRTAGGYVLASAGGHPPWTDTGSTLWQRDHPAPVLTNEQAQVWLDLSGERMLFYADQADHRGRLLYRRSDGNYGLIHPAEESKTSHQR